MLVYGWKALSPATKNRLSLIIRKHGGRICNEEQNIYSSDTGCFIFNEMKRANAVMDEIDRLKISVEADISYR